MLTQRGVPCYLRARWLLEDKNIQEKVFATG